VSISYESKKISGIAERIIDPGGTRRCLAKSIHAWIKIGSKIDGPIIFVIFLSENFAVLSLLFVVARSTDYITKAGIFLFRRGTETRCPVGILCGEKYVSSECGNPLDNGITVKVFIIIRLARSSSVIQTTKVVYCSLNFLA